MPRVLTLSMLILLCACDKLEGDDAPEETTGAGETTGAEETGEPETGTTGVEGSSSSGEVPVEDFGRGGQACEAAGAVAECQAGGVAGLEFCFTSPFENLVGLERTRWSQCLTETCGAADEHRACGEAGTQVCVRHTVDGADDLRWGVCNAELLCELGTELTCDPGDTFPCVVDGEGTQAYTLDECGFTPLVLSFGGDLEFTPAPVDAADFSLRGADSCARADWPAAATPWLALDRDGDGAIDDGSELFGSGWRLAAGGYASDGFMALAELDSDHDGAITPADAAWSSLVLWADHDADRRSNGWELLPLAGFEIEAIELGYTRTRDCDARGNCGVERAGFVYRSGGRSQRGEVIDVHLVCE